MQFFQKAFKKSQTDNTTKLLGGHCWKTNEMEQGSHGSSNVLRALVHAAAVTVHLGSVVDLKINVLL
jgi:hypothetical protein